MSDKMRYEHFKIVLFSNVLLGLKNIFPIYDNRIALSAVNFSLVACTQQMYGHQYFTYMKYACLLADNLVMSFTNAIFYLVTVFYVNK